MKTYLMTEFSFTHKRMLYFSLPQTDLDNVILLMLSTNKWLLIAIVFFCLQNEAEKYSSTGQAEEQDSEEWLQTHNIYHLKLTLKDLVDKGTIGKYVVLTYL